MEKKITKREVINAMLADERIKENEVYVGYLTHELELLDKKTTNRKPTKTQAENEDIKAVAVDVLTENGGQMTVTEMLATGAFSAEITNQKLSALLRQLKDEGKVEKIVDKKKSFFKAVVADTEVEA